MTGATGTFTFTNVQAGTYDVKVSMQGFKEAVRTDVPVTVNTVSRVDSRLELGALTESVSVVSETALLQTDKADTHTELKSQTITISRCPRTATTSRSSTSCQARRQQASRTARSIRPAERSRPTSTAWTGTPTGPRPTARPT